MGGEEGGSLLTLGAGSSKKRRVLLGGESRERKKGGGGLPKPDYLEGSVLNDDTPRHKPAAKGGRGTTKGDNREKKGNQR